MPMRRRCQMSSRWSIGRRRRRQNDGLAISLKLSERLKVRDTRLAHIHCCLLVNPIVLADDSAPRSSNPAPTVARLKLTPTRSRRSVCQTLIKCPTTAQKEPSVWVRTCYDYSTALPYGRSPRPNLSWKGSYMVHVQPALLVAQSGGPTPVINASLSGVVEEAIRRGVPRVIGARFGVQGLLDKDFDRSRRPVPVRSWPQRTPDAFRRSRFLSAKAFRRNGAASS